MWNELKRAALGFEPKQEYVALGLRAPQQEIRVRLRGCGEPRDVTLNHSIASLRPLRVALSLDADISKHALMRAKLSLEFETTTTPARVLGKIYLRAMNFIQQDACEIGLFEALGCQNDCLGTLRLYANYLYRRLETRRRPAHNLRMTHAERECSYVLYICPRPVFLVSVVWQDAGNIFPMDLVGPLGANHFVLALRNTSPSVQWMRESRRIALTSIPFEWQELVYALGKQHGQACIDWKQLAFETMLSKEFQLPVPRAALAVREVCVEHVAGIGSHSFFVTTTVNTEIYQQAWQLYHIHEFYALYRRTQEQAHGGKIVRGERAGR